eukprot:8748756-Pyramimonas_sp.AAC.1
MHPTAVHDARQAPKIVNGRSRCTLFMGFVVCSWLGCLGSAAVASLGLDGVLALPLEGVWYNCDAAM